ncbi:MAG: hypothetical protein KC478_04320, partial [Bacteriovoracaceae bacterium]|nr:hypothetical protein [Bacteriovoracaceae bacterium]
GDVAIDLTLSHAGCNDDFFGGPETKETDGQFKVFRPYECLDEKGVHDTDTTCYPSVVKSYKVELPDNFGLPGLESGCLIEDDDTTPEMTTLGARNLRIPIIAFYDNSFAMKIKVYDDISCSNGEQIYTIDNPYAGFSTPHLAQYDDSGSQGDGNPNYMRLHVDPCLYDAGKNLTPYVREGTAQKIICTPAQFDNIETLGLSATYELHRDLDFSGFPDFNNSVVSGTFNGRLLGRGHTISNVTINTSGMSNVGLFSVVDGSGSGGFFTIGEISLANINIEITDGQRVGALAGSLTGGARIDRLQIRNVDINALYSAGGPYYSIGGVVGEMMTTSFSEVHAASILNVNIDTEDQYNNVGGVVGTLGDDNSLRFAKIHEVYINTTASGTEQSYGGAIGKMDGPDSEVSAVSATNINIGSISPPSGSMSKIGGFVGDIGGGQIHLSKATGNIVSSTTGVGEVGGFAGKVSAGTGSTSIYSSISDVDIDSLANYTGGFAGSINNSAAVGI